MNDKTQKVDLEKILNKDFLLLVKDDLEDIVFTNNQKHALELVRMLEKVKHQHWAEIKKYKEIDSFYNDAIIKAKFIALPLLEDREVVILLQKHFTQQFNIPLYDLLDKFKCKLINIADYGQRDKLKKDVKEALRENTELITNDASFKTIEKWLRDYISKLGLGIVDNLKRTQYLIDLKKVHKLDDKNIERLKLLFGFYENLKHSSMTPQGFEEEFIMVQDNKNYIFKQGILEPLSKESSKTKNSENEIGQDVEIKIEELEKEKNKYKEGSLEKKMLEENLEKEKKIKEMQKVADGYKVGSFERKAVLEEIDKLKKI